jgi:hypothetical protein
MTSELMARVVGFSLAWLLPLALGGFVMAGAGGGLGVLVGGAVAMGNLWLLGRGSERALGLFAGGRLHPLWMLSVGLRHLAAFLFLALALASGRVYPPALLVGLSILPPVLIMCALRTARETA